MSQMQRQVVNIFNPFALWISLAIASIVLAENNADYYTAGVVEFRPRISGVSSVDIVNEHAAAYERIIRSVEANETDIIVFPEGTLNSDLQATSIPLPMSEINLCTDTDNTGELYASFLKRLSCAARDSKRYVVVNLKEREKCLESEIGQVEGQTCALNGWNIFNTNVVFDRTGAVVSRYRKWHTYLELDTNRTKTPEYGIFDTDFGVRFGHFICFDMLFFTPAQELVTKYGIGNIIFTSMFYSELPFLTAIQLQQSWAWGNNVNLLAAGASLPEIGASGSGIYSGANGALVRKIVGKEGVQELLVARIQKERSAPLTAEKYTSQLNSNVGHKHQNGLRLLKDPQLSNFTSELLNFTSYTQRYVKRLCHATHCCTFDIQIDPVSNNSVANHYFYRVGVFNGRRSYEESEFSDIRICALYTCTNDSVSSCGEILNSDQVSPSFIFKNIDIWGSFKRQGNILIMPNTLNFELYSLNRDEIDWTEIDYGDVAQVRIKLLVPKLDLLSFGIYVNYYDGFKD